MIQCCLVVLPLLESDRLLCQATLLYPVLTPIPTLGKVKNQKGCAHSLQASTSIFKQESVLQKPLWTTPAQCRAPLPVPRTNFCAASGQIQLCLCKTSDMTETPRFEAST